MLDFLDADSLRIIALAYWLILSFALGAAIGSFINVVVARMPLEKSLIWPSSRCGRCLQAIRWHDNLPLISYLWLRGRCRACGVQFSSRYFWVELATGLGFAGLFWLVVVANVHGWPQGPFLAMPPWQLLVGFVYHAILFAFLMAASVCDLETREIPLGLTLTGTALGLVGAIFLAWPWPWPATHPSVVALVTPVQWQDKLIPQGVYPWPFWGPLPAICPPGSWETGLATGLAGALAGTFLMRTVGFVFGTGLGKEAMGLGDADLMMMAGAFLGWQIVLVAFLLSVFPALIFGVVRMVVWRDNALPFGPSLSMGVIGTCLGWHWIGPQVQSILFFGLVVVCFLGIGAGILLVMSFMMRLIQQPEVRSENPDR